MNAARASSRFDLGLPAIRCAMVTIATPPLFWRGHECFLRRSYPVEDRVLRQITCLTGNEPAMRTASNRQLARTLGISETAVRKAEKAGRIRRSGDGSWDLEQ